MQTDTDWQTAARAAYQDREATSRQQAQTAAQTALARWGLTAPVTITEATAQFAGAWTARGQIGDVPVAFYCQLFTPFSVALIRPCANCGQPVESVPRQSKADLGAALDTFHPGPCPACTPAPEPELSERLTALADQLDQVAAAIRAAQSED